MPFQFFNLEDLILPCNASITILQSREVCNELWNCILKMVWIFGWPLALRHFALFD